MYASSSLLTCFEASGLSYTNTQNPIQMKPRAPMMMNETSHPKFLARTGIVSGAKSAPMEAPALNMDVAKALSFLGKYSAVVLIAAGKFPASPSARILLATRKQYMLIVEIRTAVSPVA